MLFVKFSWNPYPAMAYTALPEHSGMLTGTWRSAVPLICFDIIELHLPEHALHQYSMVQGIPLECNTDSHLHRSNRMGPVPEELERHQCVPHRAAGPKARVLTTEYFDRPGKWCPYDA